MRAKVRFSVSHEVDIEIPDAEKVLIDFKGSIQSNADMDDLFSQGAFFADDVFIEGIGKTGKDFIIHDHDTDVEYDNFEYLDKTK